ncbi:jg7829 [Pararge aegeria aegeria]|uniref:Jg7829 protein n=1 Tax=Pararge aegeria aegeria TaxID=348720 RepID=A0A8S4RM42_9NEOP|nr:jg7829 [Pararge aegeria aegeria]
MSHARLAGYVYSQSEGAYSLASVRVALRGTTGTMRNDAMYHFGMRKWNRFARELRAAWNVWLVRLRPWNSLLCADCLVVAELHLQKRYVQTKFNKLPEDFDSATLSGNRVRAPARTYNFSE